MVKAIIVSLQVIKLHYKLKCI